MNRLTPSLPFPAMGVLSACMIIGLSSVTATAQAPLWLGDWYPTLEVQVTSDDNINRSFDGDGDRSDVVFEPALRLQQQYPLADRTFAYLGGAVEGAIHGRYNKLNFVAPVISSGIRQVLGEGHNAPIFLAGLSLKYEFHQQDARFGAEANPRLELEFPFEDLLVASLYYEYDNRFESDNPVYDRSGHTFGLDTETVVTDHVSIIAGYSYRRGDVLVHQPRDDLGEEIRGKRYPIDTFTSRYDAVSIDDEDTHQFRIGLRYKLSLFTALNIGFAYEDIRADGESYPSQQMVLGVTHLL